MNTYDDYESNKRRVQVAPEGLRFGWQAFFSKNYLPGD